MNKDDIVKYVHELDWSYPVETQNEAIDILSRIDGEYLCFAGYEVHTPVHRCFQ